MLHNRIRNFNPIFSQSYEPFVIQKQKKCTKDTENIYLKIGVLGKFKGSAYMEYEQTKIICFVFPPQEPAKNSKNINLKSVVNCEYLITQYASKTKVDNRNTKQKSLASTLKKSLEPLICRQEFLSFKIRIYVLVIEDGGHILSTALNCCGAALADGGIPIYDICAGSSFISKNQYNFDDNNENLTDAITAYSKKNQISECYHKGYVKMDKFKEQLMSILSKNDSILLFLKNILIKNVTER